jgi:hypothetical protein
LASECSLGSLTPAKAQMRMGMNILRCAREKPGYLLAFLLSLLAKPDNDGLPAGFWQKPLKILLDCDHATHFFSSFYLFGKNLKI